MSSPKQQPSRTRTKPRSFAYFPRLPPELRRQVWKQASFHPRDVDITASFDAHTLTTEHEANPARFHYLSVRPPPALLSVNHESRSEGLKWYMPIDYFTSSREEEQGRPFIYINWKTDRICLVNWGLLASWWHQHAGLDFKARCKRNGLRRLACNLQGSYFERTVRDFLKVDVEVDEIAFFHSSVTLYDGCGRKRRWRLEDRRMNQVGAYGEIVGLVNADRKAKVEARDLGEESGKNSDPVALLEVKLVRFI